MAAYLVAQLAGNLAVRSGFPLVVCLVEYWEYLKVAQMVLRRENLTADHSGQ